MHDISKKFKWNSYDARIASRLIAMEETPEAITFFAESCGRLTDYGYWFLLSTCWVGYSGWSDINLWRRLFSSIRPGRMACIMKPSELKIHERLPWRVTAYRAHRPGETDWLAYTLNREIACRFARERGVDRITVYRVKKRDILALFLRRGEEEILVLDRTKAEKIGEEYL